MTTKTTISVLTVCYNGHDFLDEFFASLFSSNLEANELEVIMIDNGSSDDSVTLVRENFPSVTVLLNDENNYAGALNLGIRQSRGEFIIIVNNDATVHPDWLLGLLEVIQADETIGAVQSKIFFAGTGRINSVGVEEVDHFYFKDIGFDEEDRLEFTRATERNYVTGCSVMFRRACLEDVGDWDEALIMYMEDVDYSIRCRAKGWKLWFSPGSILYHHYHRSASDELCAYFCSRNRFLLVARYYPLELVGAIRSSHFYQEGQYDNLYRALLSSVRVMCQNHDTNVVSEVLQALKSALPDTLGEVSTYNFFSQLEILLGLRKIRVGIYNHAGHFSGGGQRYVAEMANLMQDRYDITYIFNNDVSLDQYKEWFDLDLSRCAMKVIKIPFFEKRNRYLPDESMVLMEKGNVFDIISRESLNYDIFINANMLSKVNPLAVQSIFVCHFPDQEKTRFFQVDKYDHLVVNGGYTGRWVEQRWQLQPTHKLYPPVSMDNPESSPEHKENIILSISRFEISGSKKQLELVQAFQEFCEAQPEQTRGWKLILVGGSTPDNSYLERVKEQVARAQFDIEVRANASFTEIKNYYRKAAIFWHACGLDESKPERVEHFGMTTVESMQNYCVPIVIDGGGQREIVEHEKSGYRFTSLEELQKYSLLLMSEQALRQRMAANAHERSKLFNHEVFANEFEILLEEVEANLTGDEVL